MWRGECESLQEKGMQMHGMDGPAQGPCGEVFSISVYCAPNVTAWVGEFPDKLQESLGPFGPEVSRRVSPRVSLKTGAS